MSTENKKPIKNLLKRVVTIHGKKADNIIAKAIKKHIIHLTKTPDLFDKNDRETIIDILRNPSNMRSPSEIGYLKRAFENIHFFQKLKQMLSEENFRGIFQRTASKRLHQYKTVFKYKDKAYFYYLILNGQVCILQPKNKALHKYSDFKLFDEDKKWEDWNEKQFSEILNQHPNHKLVQILNVGDSFGKNGFLKKSQRKATIVCSKDSHFLILNKIWYDKILGKLVKSNINAIKKNMKKTSKNQTQKKLFNLKFFRIFLQTNQSKFKNTYLMKNTNQIIQFIQKETNQNTFILQIVVKSKQRHFKSIVIQIVIHRN